MTLRHHDMYSNKAHVHYILVACGASGHEDRAYWAVVLGGGSVYQLCGVGGLKVVLAAWPKATAAGLRPHQLLTQAVVEGHLLELQRRAVPQVVRLAQVLIIKHRQVPIEVPIKHRQVPRY